MSTEFREANLTISMNRILGWLWRGESTADGEESVDPWSSGDLELGTVQYHSVSFYPYLLLRP